LKIYSSGTSAGERKLMPTIQEELEPSHAGDEPVSEKKP